MAWFADLSAKITGLFGNKTPSAHFGAFGKHPAWNDHLDDIGLDSEPLVAAKQYLYVQGIGGVIDSGQWDALPPEDALADFRHLFFWIDSEHQLSGRLWSSSDGKGRTRYPMVVCAHFANRHERSFPNTLSFLEQVEQACRASDSQDAVRHNVALARNTTQNLLREPAVPEPGREQFAQRLALFPVSEPALRIAYAAETYLSHVANGSGSINLRLGQSKVQPQHLRVPADPAAPLESFAFWHAFVSAFVPASVPQLYIVPLHARWLDVIAGLPTARHLACIKTGGRSLPPASEIPFNFTTEAQAEANACWNRFLTGLNPSAD